MVGEAQLHGCVVVDTVMEFNDSTQKKNKNKTKNKNIKIKKEPSLSWNHQASKAPCADQPANIQTLIPFFVSG